MRNMTKNRPDDLLENDVRELIMQRELNLAGIGTQRRKPPVPGELLERTVHELHIDRGRPRVHITRREMLLDALEIDVILRFHPAFALLPYLNASTPPP